MRQKKENVLTMGFDREAHYSLVETAGGQCIHAIEQDGPEDSRQSVQHADRSQQLTNSLGWNMFGNNGLSSSTAEATQSGNHAARNKHSGRMGKDVAKRPDNIRYKSNSENDNI
ncbi:hypothetical protein HG531_010515 [Fusarium graminearum]|nr:hypothetical protein HG531_010515 [Fusarium graminearum]